MEKTDSIADINDSCTGCKLCETVCPHSAITFSDDEEGFWQPIVADDQCTNCGLCRKKCPALLKEPVGQHAPVDVYGGWNQDQLTHQKSSSGGVFSLLAQAVLEQDGLVYGAVFKDDWTVKHIRATSPEEVARMRGAKYIQSDCTVYSQIAADLKQGRKVLFSGTPCQVAALRSYLDGKVEQEQLLCLDFVCNSVNSPLLFTLYCRHQEHRANAKIAAINFRDTNIRNTTCIKSGLSFTFDNGAVHKKDIYSDPFRSAHMLHYFIRKACYDCPFAQSGRYGDLTIADFWGVPPQHLHKDGVSLILVNTETGQAYFEVIKDKLSYFPSSFETAAKGNPCLGHPMGGMKTWQQHGRDRINELIREDNLSELFDVFLRGNIVKRTAFLCKFLLDRTNYLRSLLMSKANK